jgi:integrase
MEVYAGAPTAARRYLEAGRGRADDHYLAQGTGMARRFAAEQAARYPAPQPAELVSERGDELEAVHRWNRWPIRCVRPKVAGLPEAFRFHDLRHHLASLLIGSGLDVKVVQHRRRHGSAKTTLDTYGPPVARQRRVRTGRRRCCVVGSWGLVGD